MAQEDLAIRFSNKMYATKLDVSRTLGISQIDTIWSNIVSYRSHFTNQLEIRNIERTPFNIVLTPLILQNVTSIERKLTKAMVRYAKLSMQDITRYDLRRMKLVNCLSHISAKYKLDISEDFLMKMVLGEVSSIAPKDMIVQRYLNSLLRIEKFYDDPLSEQTLRMIFDEITGVSDVETIYRSDDIDNDGSKIIINRVYNAAPVERIAPMMENLFDFLNNSDESFFVKAIATFYLMQYTKPFDIHSEEVALLFMKQVLAHNELDQLAAILDFEILLNDRSERYAQVLQEVQRTNDLTYLLIYAVEQGEKICQNILDSLTELDTHSIAKEFFKEEKEIARNEVENEYRVEEKSIENISSKHVDYEIKVALPIMPIGLDERDATRIEEHLLEMNPNLKKGDAFFYARHCTIGKYYTIQQYKKATDCAYETARTSMDRLVYEGFYRKEMIKNKFVYTPIPRK